jgi:DNA-binding GntR family transcriptional regulator
MAEGRVDTLYAAIKDQAVNFVIRPGERINEVAMARAYNTSRTPLREALNRLVSEQLIDTRPGLGFFGRPLEPKNIHALYDLREILETAAIRRATGRAARSDLTDLNAMLERDRQALGGATIRDVTARDESFHEAIATLSGNEELVRSLRQINERIRFIRWADMAARVHSTKDEHQAMLDAMLAQDADTAVAVMRAHITKRMDQIVAAVKEGYSNIYVSGPEELFGRMVDPVEG